MSEFNTLFYKNQYLKEFDTTVIDCVEIKEGYMIVLDNTAFYPEGGGQPSDRGFLNGIEVYDVKKNAGLIYHYMKQKIEINQNVHGLIDWKRRFDHMQQHSGEHIFSGIVHKHFGYENVGFHMGEDFLTLDFSGQLNWQQVKMVETEANELIYRNVEIKELFPNAKQLTEMSFRSKKELGDEVRIIEIEDGDVCACCGTHVKSTGEIGLIKALSCANKGDGSRVTIMCGKRALNYLQDIYEQSKSISVALAAKPLEIEKAVAHLQKINSDYKTKIYLFQKNYFENKIKSFKESDKPLIVFEENIDNNDFRKYVDELAKHKKGSVVFGFNENEAGYNYVIVSYCVRLKEMNRKFNELVNGRGGGSEQLLQGNCKADKETIVKVINDMM